MSDATFPNNQTLVSSALTPDGVAVIFQPLIAQIFDYDTTNNQQQAYSAVRVGWPPAGQPSWGQSDDICFITVKPIDDPFSRTRDELIAANDQVSVVQQMGFTQIWNIHCTLYGPNCYDRARLILSAITLDWVLDSLKSSNLYLIPGPNRPVYAPELFQGAWWKRTDIDLTFNEQVTESIIVPTGASVQITIQTDHGISETFTAPRQ